MKKNEMIDLLAHKSGISAALAEHVYENMLDIIGEALCVEEVVILGNVGRFHVRYRNAYHAKNPYSGETILVPAQKVVSFKPSKKLRFALQQALSKETC